MVMTNRTKCEFHSLQTMKEQLSLVRRLNCHTLRLFTRPDVDILQACLVP